MRSLVLVALVAHAAAADDRPLHGSAGAGTTLLLTGDRDDRNRFEAEVDLEPHSRYGAFLAWRGFDDHHDGIPCGGLVYEAAAARPRLVLDFHGDVGFDLDVRAPMVGGGLRTTLTLVGPLGLALDTGGYLVIDGVDNTRLVIAAGAALVVRY